MQTLRSPARAPRGSALITVIFLTAMFAILTTSILRYTLSERRDNERNRLQLRAKNMAENISVYAAEQLTTKLYRSRATSAMAFIGGSNQINLPDSSGNASVLSNVKFADVSGMEVRAGMLDPSAYALVTDQTDANYGLQVSTATIPIIAKATVTHPSLGAQTSYVLQEMEIAMTPLFQFGLFYNMDLELFPGQNMSIMGPVHTNGRLMARGEVGGSAVLTFSDRVSAAAGLYADGQLKVPYRNRSGASTAGAGGTGAVNFAKINGTLANLSNGSIWRDHKYGQASESATTLSNFKSFTTTTYGTNVRTNVHGVTKLELPGIGSYSETNLSNTSEDDRNNGRQIIEPPNPTKYISGAWTDTTDDADAKASKISWQAGLYIAVNPDDDVRYTTLPDGTSATLLPYSYRAWINAADSSGTHTCAEVVLPGQPAYGYNNNGTPADTSDDFMYANNLPNRYTTATTVGANQILRIAQTSYSRVKTYNGSAWVATDAATLPNGVGYSHVAGTIPTFPAEASATPYPGAEAYFFDLRRANGNQGYTSNVAGGSARSSVNYVPRAISKIDFDMARFKMMVARSVNGATSSTGYKLQAPDATVWSNSIFNPSGATTSLDLGLDDPSTAELDYIVLPPASGGTLAERTRQDPFRLYYAPASPTAAATIASLADDPRGFAVPASVLYDGSTPDAWFDGLAVYVHSVDAERHAQTGGVPVRIDSGVRLWNGRGNVASLTAVNRTGFTFATNDAVYIIGHFNADGTVNATTTSTGNGGYSARFPDNASEKLCAVMGDAVTLLSQPVFSTATTPYSQVNGWNDALSAFRITSTSWSASWRSAAPSGSNNYEGLGTSATAIRPGAMPNNSTPGAAGSTRQTKLPPVDTEFSTALLVGIVPSNHNATGLTDLAPYTGGANNQYSGGAHNFPRLLEDWHCDMGSGTTANLVIRGSMIALFESRVAMEPWNIRCYAAPNRLWGLHEGFRTAGHDVPLEPILLSNRRRRYMEQTAAEYADLKTTIEALPH
jgi:Tfp pilus assembly protein PilX